MEQHSKIHHLALAIVYQIERIGFPKKENSGPLRKLIEDLKKLAPHLSASDQKSVDLIDESVREMERMLEKGEEISLHTFAILNKRIILLQLSLEALS